MSLASMRTVYSDPLICGNRYEHSASSVNVVLKGVSKFNKNSYKSYIKWLSNDQKINMVIRLKKFLFKQKICLTKIGDGKATSRC